MDSDQEETRPESSLTIQHYQAQIRGLNTTIQNLNTTVTRLRESRDLHRSNAKTLTATNTELQAKIQALTIKEETVTPAEPLDSDVDEQPIKLEVTKTGPPSRMRLAHSNQFRFGKSSDFAFLNELASFDFDFFFAFCIPAIAKTTNPPHHYFKHLPGLLPHIDTPVACVRRPAT
ncbi:hypothetical protein HO173_013054 [Letharia columbiana]|uniref:Uncharacterized protein n=1 Tax=Letharia columbiana TaxID=112416 RepID=A0A8H6CJ96_9LECA|nr:uncharacterized protein HO173_013054 [Letharia columbiana]KAF6224537.1 hypothetical protein HO173_013054 [Letharia columbiana]